jgi:hypothetical protein
MNAITLFFDRAAGAVNNPTAFFAADAATQARIMADWRANDALLAAAFADRIGDFVTDAQIGRAFLTPQLYRIETEVYMRKYPSFDFGSLMFVNTDGDMWDVGTVFYSMDQVGRAEFLSGKGFDMPYASTLMEQNTQAFHLAGIGYEWTVQEMQRAARLGRSLSSDKAMAADQASQAFLWNIAMTGRTPGAATSEKGWTGLVNNASVPTANVAADGTGSATTFASKTPDQILRDVNAALEAVVTNTGETHTANTLMLPTTTFQQMARTRLTDTPLTVMEFIRQNNAYKALTGQDLTIRSTRALETAGASSTKRMVAYDNSREVIRFHLPGPHEFLPAFQKGSMTYEVGGIMNVGGTEIRLPKAIRYSDGI